jgi:hypothetical protein
MVLTGLAVVMQAGSWSPRVIITSLYLVGALLVGAIVIAAVSRWRRRGGREVLTPGEQLTRFRTLYEQGAISAEEFGRLRSMLTGQVHPIPTSAKPSAGVTPEPGSSAPPDRETPPEEGIRPA